MYTLYTGCTMTYVMFWVGAGVGVRLGVRLEVRLFRVRVGVGVRLDPGVRLFDGRGQG